MTQTTTNFRGHFAFFIVLMVIACSPVWAFPYFINQDGSGHLHTAYLMTELLKGNPSLSEFYTFNSFAIPNASGHWLLAGLLPVFDPFVITKIMVTLTYAGFVAGCGWLRFKTFEREGVRTSLLIGAAMGFNWLWLVGFYNFIIGTVVLLVTVALYYKWREGMTMGRTVALAVLLLLGYHSHIISFLVLAGSVAVLAVFSSSSNRLRTLVLTGLAMLPVFPLLVIYKNLSESGEGFSPVWRSLSDVYSLSAWIYQIRAADPFIIMTRRSLPFISANSSVFAIFTPALWLVIAFVFLMAASYFYYVKNSEELRPILAFMVLAAGSLFLAAFSPDDFNQTNGGVLRERIVIFSFLFLIPIFRTGRSAILKRAAQCTLGFVVLFQTLAVWEYARDSNQQATEFMAGAAELRRSRSTVLITFGRETMRFHANTIPQLNCYNGIGNNNIVWDNYEFGHFLFPLVTKNDADRQFIHDLTTSQFFSLDNPADGFDDRFNRLSRSMEAYHGRIDTLALWGNEPRVEELLERWFESEPYFHSGRLRLFRRR